MSQLYTVLALNGDRKLIEEHIDLRKPWSGYVPQDSVIFNPNQPRKYFDKEALAQLGGSLRGRQEAPITAIKYEDPKLPKVRWMINDGERRWRSSGAEGLGTVWICYQPGVNLDNLHTASFKSNFCREGHTHTETAHAIEHELRSGKSYAEIATMVGRSKAWAVNEHNLLKLHPDLLQRMDPPTKDKERLPMATALLLTSVSHEEQFRILKQTQMMGRKEAYHFVRFARGNAVQATDGRKRKKSDDVYYLTGKINQALKQLATFESLPEQMHQSLNGVDITETLAKLDDIIVRAENLKKIISDASKGIIQMPVPQSPSEGLKEKVV